jgi:large subunit ribosomal protein L22
MTQTRAITKYVRISPRKARLAAGLIRGLNVADASSQLKFSGLKAGRLLLKTLDSAVANAENNDEARREDLKVVEVRIDEGPTMKRAKARSRGSRSPINKRSSHLTVVVGTESEVE